jgi:histidyl-tRNA synthetase
MIDSEKKINPRTLPGFMELLPNEQIKFNKMKKTIENSYEKFGFLPLNTPIIEASEVLLAKAGGETEKQIYRFTKGDNDLSLRFDLTVPLAKFVAQNMNSLTFPFRRYQIGKVFRGERPQQGRFREFYQADIDIIGDGSLNVINDAEIPSIIYSTFKNLGFDNFVIKINNRKILSGFFENLNLSNKVTDILRIIDKLDKIGIDLVKEELRKYEIDEESINKIISFINIVGTNDDIINKLKLLDINNSKFEEGIKEIEDVVKYIRIFGVPENNFNIDLTIARGLDYYTGTVYETILNDYPQIGSVCSGGRYDDLAEYYTDRKLPGVGVSIGLTRFFYQLNKIGFFEDKESYISKVLVISMSEDIGYALNVTTKLRLNGINTEFDNTDKKLKNKLNYANKLNIPYVIFIGEDEILNNNVTIKNMESGEQKTLSLDEVIEILK